MASDTHGRKKRKKLAAQLEDELLVLNLETPVVEPEPGSKDATSTDDEEYLIPTLDGEAQYVSRWDDAAEFIRTTADLLSTAMQRLIYAAGVILVLVMGLEGKLSGNLVIAGLVLLVLAGGGRELLHNPTTRGFLKKLLKLLESGDSDD